MCSIQLVGIESTKYFEVKDMIHSFLESNDFNIEIQENKGLDFISDLDLTSIPTVNYRSITLDLGGVDYLEYALLEMFDAIKFDYNRLTYRCKNSGLFSNCTCY